VYNLFRKQWRCFRPGGEPWFVVREDSLLDSLLRRYVGPLFGLLRTNFFFFSRAGEKIGRFDRQFTIRDRYVLDMTADSERAIDRRVAVAMGVMLDTGERR
jgi:hypothetical protein